MLVREARLQAGLSIDELAGRLGIPADQVEGWEDGSEQLSLEALKLVVRACGLDLRLSLVPYDDSDSRHIAQALARSPAERLDALVNMLEVEHWAHRARPVSDVT